MDILTLAGLLLAAFALGAVIVLAAWAMQNAELESVARGKAHSYATAAGLEDALAIQFDVALHATQALQYVQARSAQMNQVLGDLRKSPQSYNPDRPAGPRPQVKP